MGSLQGVQRKVLGSFWMLPGTLFGVFFAGFVMHMKKGSLAMFFVANLRELPLQKQANRTVHPLKIEDGLVMVCIFCHVLTMPSFFLPKQLSVAPKLTTQAMLFGMGYKSWILDALGPVWSSTLGSFWRARRGTRPPKIGFFLTPAASE